ncbi:ribbon-helix-helix domain-containing protein [Sphingomonas suaedae]|uniref:ribbon-helix-helix domain-containing protein n=1 Tax=Sphingomonas suaedae TaxID=2599297 RepID=UPI001647CFDB|nr:type II toxin-antitoxin system ParD family antitoxin [Sphingomonas suaedae]
MTTLTVSLPDDLREVIEARVKAGIYKDVDSYVRGLIRADLTGDDWLTPEVVAAIEVGEASGYVAFDYEAFKKEMRETHLNETRSQFRSD